MVESSVLLSRPEGLLLPTLALPLVRSGDTAALFLLAGTKSTSRDAIDLTGRDAVFQLRLRRGRWADSCGHSSGKTPSGSKYSVVMLYLLT